MIKFPFGRALLLALPGLLALSAAAEPGGGKEPGGDRPEIPRRLRFVWEKRPDGAGPLLRHATARARSLRYAGTRRREVLAKAGGRAGEVSSKSYRVERSHFSQPVGAGLARVFLYSEDRLTAARQAGRDLAKLPARPSGGVRVTAVCRRLGPRGAEPAAGDRTLQRTLSPVPELPRLPAGELSAGRPVVRRVGDYQVTWKLLGSGLAGGRKCWVLVREVSLAPGAPGGAAQIHSRAEYLLSAEDSVVLWVRSRWAELAENLVHRDDREVFLEEAGGKRPEEEAAGGAARTAAVRELLRALSARSVERVERLARRAREAGYRGPALRLAARFIAAEKELAEARGGARRIELVPEDSAVFLSAPRRLEAGRKLVPVVFLHGAGAHAEAYFKDWRRRAGSRPLLLVFPQSRDWTWSLQSDGAMVGSLLDILGRAYELEKDKLVLAGHSAGAEMAFALGYGASFPGYRVRGIVAAGATVPRRIRLKASESKPPELVARLRAVDVLLLGGMRDKKYRPEAVKNCARWLTSWNDGGVTLVLSRDVATRYSADWTPDAVKWIEKLVARPAAGPPKKAD